MDSFLEINDLLNKQFEPFFREEISPQLEVPDCIIPISYTFVNGPTLTLEIPTKVIKECYQTRGSFLDIVVEDHRKGVVFMGPLHREVSYSTSNSIITFFPQRARISTGCSDFDSSHSLSLTIQPQDSYVNISAISQKYCDFGSPAFVEKSETFSKGAYYSIDFTKKVERANSSEDFMAISNETEMIYDDFNQQTISKGQVFLKPLMDFIRLVT